MLYLALLLLISRDIQLLSTYLHGGVSRNVVEDIANLELKPTFVTVLDHSGISTDVLEKLNKHNVNTKYVVRTDDGLGTWLAIFDNSGDVLASISKRPELAALEGVLDQHGDEIFADADSIVVEIDMEVPILKKIFALAEKYHKDVYAVVSNMSIAMERQDPAGSHQADGCYHGRTWCRIC